ncbi:MAG: phosphate signaling complex protein PhoU [Anaerolineae bacterium]|nr:phosphate signaling complex protein PhoU [Anaerolineae bacterium]
MIYEIFGEFDLTLALEIVSKIALAMLLGGLVGWERERHQMPAGVRTFILVSVGACIFTFLSYHAFGQKGDPARVAAQVVSGIGFLGAGMVMQHKGAVHGLTSAAGIWAVAAVGMAVGAGDYFLAIFGAVAIFIVLGVLRQVFKREIVTATKRTLTVALRQVRGQIETMGRLVCQAIHDGVQAVAEDNHELALLVLQGEDQINQLRYQVEEECHEILRTQRPEQVQLRTVMAATHVVTNLERIGDYAKEIAKIRLQMDHEPLLTPLVKTPQMADQVCGMLQRVLVAFAEDDVKAATAISHEIASIDQVYQDIVETVTAQMTSKKSRHFERGAYLLNMAYYLKRAGERVVNIAERIVFVRTGALAELDREE